MWSSHYCEYRCPQVGISVRKGGSYFNKKHVGAERNWRDMNAFQRLCLEACGDPVPCPRTR